MRDSSDTTGSPYPGLRPFQEFESAYFYGRLSQVSQVVERLRHASFVAVLGGSGSGKSSLILAGVVPRLRTFALSDAGDFWVPVVSTPGTDHGVGQSPITRLARKFCSILSPLAEPGASDRIEDCVRLLRTVNGFGLMTAKYAPELANTESVDPQSANFLLVIDQFEELFHPSNRNEPDCEALVNRVLESVSDREAHKRVFVVITMRSEHLSSCAQYLDLPDAINNSSYLVRRLDQRQIAEAIERPSTRYLRFLTRFAHQRNRDRDDGPAEQDVSTLPDSCAFDATVLQILIAHADDLKSNPDHLPLLQHLLYRLWERSSERMRATGMLVPDKVVLQDLYDGILRDPARPLPTRQEDVKGDNCLEECLENWAEKIFTSYRPERRDELEKIFRSLAFKEPNTGTYTQQRVAFSELVQSLGFADVAALHAFLKLWLEPHAYLFWDDESSTLKVAHESLIRGWSRFHRWIDDDDEMFQEYVRLLGECQGWQENKRNDDYLVDGVRLKRLTDIKLEAAIADPRTLARFAKLLDLHRDGKKLEAASHEVASFLHQSVEKDRRRQDDRAQRMAAERRRLEQERERDQELARAEEVRTLKQAHEKKQLRTTFIAWGSAIAFLFGVSLVFLWSEYQLSKKERLLHRAYALASETTLATDRRSEDLDSTQKPLRNVLVGGWHRVEGNEVWLDPVTRLAAWMSGRGERLDAIERTSVLAEMRMAAALQGALKIGVWKVPKSGGEAIAVQGETCNLVESNAKKLIDSGTAEGINIRFVAHPAGPSTGERYGLVYVRQDGRAQILHATMGASKDCNRVGVWAYDLPTGLRSRAAIDANLGHLLVGTPNTAPGAPYVVQRLDILWPTGPQGAPTVQDFSSVSNDEFAKAIWPKDEPFRILPSIVRTNETAFDLDLGSQRIRLFHLEPIAVNVAQGQWTDLAAAAPIGLCASLEKGLAADDARAFAQKPQGTPPPANGQNPSEIRAPAHGTQPDPKAAMWETTTKREHICVRVTPRPGPTYAYSVSVFKFTPGTDPTNKRVPAMANVDFGYNPINKLRIGKEGEPNHGWIIAAADDSNRWVGSPWSVEEWQRLSCEVYRRGGGEDLPRYRTVFDLVLGTTEELEANPDIDMSKICPGQ